MSTIELDELQATINEMGAEERLALVKQLERRLKSPFLPNSGPQTEALLSQADILLYGGAAGGGKTALEVGCPVLNHREAIIFRREATQLDGLIEFSKEILSGLGTFNKVEKVWSFGGGKRLKFAGLPQVDDWRKHAGNARDYMAFDEAGEFTREQVFSLLAWLRSTDKDQRCRVILGSNPPRGGDGEWMLTEFAPWLDEGFGNPAEPGELRWAIVVADETEWVDGPGTYVRDGEDYEAMSRTFIPAKLGDNPYLANTGYQARVMALPEPLRSQLLYGDFKIGREDHELQVLPSEWIRLAQERWTKKPPDMPMSAVAVDVAQGGPDKTQIQARYGNWWSEFQSYKGSETPNGPAVASRVVQMIKDQCPVIVDAGGGYGGDTITQLDHMGIPVKGFDGSRRSTVRSRDNMFGFRNLRAQMLWQFRESLDPEFGSQIMLPPDRELYADLCAYRYEIKGSPTAGGVIQICKKDDIRDRLGHSPDKGDCCMMLFGAESRALVKTHAGRKRKDSFIKPERQQKAITGRDRRGLKATRKTDPARKYATRDPDKPKFINL